MNQLMKNWARKVPFATKTVHAMRRRRWLRERDLAFVEYGHRHVVRKLQIGSGTNILDGWFNVDIFPVHPNQYYVDSTQGLPFDDATFDYVFSEHMIEHITYLQGRAMLLECFRVTKPGGRIRIATPDLRKIASLYSMSPTQQQKSYIEAVFARWRGDYDSHEVGIVVNNIFGFEHEFIYDRGTLGELIEKAGFQDIVECLPGTSCDPVLSGIDAHAMDYIAFETLVLEARRADAGQAFRKL